VQLPIQQMASVEDEGSLTLFPTIFQSMTIRFLCSNREYAKFSSLRNTP